MGSMKGDAASLYILHFLFLTARCYKRKCSAKTELKQKVPIPSGKQVGEESAIAHFKYIKMFLSEYISCMPLLDLVKITKVPHIVLLI